MDAVVRDQVLKLFPGSNNYISPMGTEFIEFSLEGREYMLSFSPQRIYYMLTENNKLIYGSDKDKDILTTLARMQGAPLAY